MARRPPDRNRLPSPGYHDDWALVPAGALCVFRDGAVPVLVLQPVQIEVAPDGDLLLSEPGQTMSFPPGGWIGLGVVWVDDENQRWVRVFQFPPEEAA